MKSLVLSLFVLCVGCSSSSDDDELVICTEQFVYGLQVSVTNASTNSVITDGIVVIATEGDYSEELMNHPNSDSFVGAGERTGNYSISVTGVQYESFTTEVIVVEMTDDGCHVITEIVAISLIGI